MALTLIGFSGSTGRQTRAPEPRRPVGLSVSNLHLRGFRVALQAGERKHLDSLELGNPEQIQDYFLITEDKASFVSRAVCVLYHNVFLLCRHQTEKDLISWDLTSSR